MPPLPWLLNLNRIVIIIIINQYPHPYHYHPSHQPLPSIMRGGLCMSGMDSDHTRPRTISLLLLGSGITDYPSNSLSFLTRFSLFVIVPILRLNSVKNTNFGLDNKKSFLMHSKIVFGVTDHICIK